jgi:signal transduction histidine kinase
VTFEALVANDLRMPVDKTDLAEVLGNLLENAVRHAARRVRITADCDKSGPSVAIEDDGKGIGEDQLLRVLERGVRVDERGGGSAGLGLAIVQDVLDAYGWRLDLSKSVLGGLKATICPASKGLRNLDPVGAVAT